MKYFKRFMFIGVIFMITLAMIGCSDTGTPIPENPPDEEILDFLDVVPGGFFQLVCISDYGTFSRSAGDVTVVSDTYIVFEETGDISLWYDNEPNGILEPEDYVGSAGTWELVDGVLTIDGEEFLIKDVSEDAWTMTMDISDQFEECLGDYEVTGTRTFCYERANPVYMTPDMLITTDFNLVYDDMGDVIYAPYDWWDHTAEDCSDMIGFTFGDIQFLLYNVEYGYSYVNVDGNIYSFEGYFEPNEVYDVEIYVQTNGVGKVTAVSRADGDVIYANIEADYAGLGSVELKQVNDADTNLL